jgi:hypothetical protein
VQANNRSLGIVLPAYVCLDLNRDQTKRLGFVGTRTVGEQGFNRVGSFDAPLLLKLIDPVRHGLNHFARGLGRSVALGAGFSLRVRSLFLITLIVFFSDISKTLIS